MSVYKNVKLLAWFNLFLDFRLYAPVAILYFTQVAHSFTLGLSIFSITMVASAMFEVPTGILSDYVGRKRTVILGACAGVLSVVCYAIGQAYWIIATGALFEGLARSLYSGNNDALLYGTLAETGREAEYHAFLGKVSTSFQVALAISALCGSIIANWSFALVMWLSVLPQAICLVLSLFLVEPQTQVTQSGNIYVHLREAFLQFRRNKQLRLLTIAGMLDFSIGETAYQFQAVFIGSLWPVWAIGLAKMISNIGAALSFWFSGRIINRLTAIKTLIYSQIGSRIIGILALGFASVGSPLLMASSSLLFGASVVAQNTLLQREFTDNQRATMGSLNSFAGSLAFGICALLVGLVADRFGARESLLIAEVLRLPILALYWRVIRQRV